MNKVAPFGTLRPYASFPLEVLLVTKKFAKAALRGSDLEQA